MVNQFPMKKRQKLQKVMIKAFENEIKELDSNLKSILIDDMITAFYNRIIVLKKIQPNH
jgi:hypothetical protein